MPVFESTNILLTVDDSWLIAQAQFKFFTNTKALVAELMELLKNNGITSINKYNVKKALVEKNPKEKYVITQGIKPVNGKKEHYKLLIDLSKKPEPVKKEDGSVDFKALILPNLVKKGDPVLKKIPEDSGTPGKTIKGEAINPQIVAVKSVKPTKDLIPEQENSNIFVANKAGLVVVDEGIVKVTGKLVVNGDVNFTTGNINFPGDVRVAGDVKSGFGIIADGSVEVQGTVEDAELIVGGNLQVKRGFSGTGNGKIKCDNTVHLSYAVNQTIECKDLKFHKEIVNCNVRAEKEITSEFGKIISGDIQAGYAINVNQIGHEESAAAKIVVGSKSELAEKKKELEEKIEEHRVKLKQIKGQLYELFKKQIKKVLSESDEEKLKEMQLYKSEAPDIINDLEEELTKINAEYEEIKKAHLTVKGILYQGTKIEVLGQKVPIQKQMRKIKFCLHKDEISSFNV